MVDRSNRAWAALCLNVAGKARRDNLPAVARVLIQKARVFRERAERES